jgi:hypothetical protein
MSLRFVYDFTDGWSIEGEPDRLFDITFVSAGAGRIPATGMSFGWDVLVNGLTIESGMWPEPGIKWLEVTPGDVYSLAFPADYDDEVVITVWFAHDGQRDEFTHTFAAPATPQPHASWVWNGSEWEAPFPCPEYGAIYAWSENRQEWVGYPEDESVQYDWDPETEVWVER